MPQTTETPLQRLIRARAGLLAATLRPNRPRRDLVPVVVKLDAAIQAMSTQRTRPRASAFGYRSGHPALRRKKMLALMLQLDEYEMRLGLPPTIRRRAADRH